MTRRRRRITEAAQQKRPCELAWCVALAFGHELRCVVHREHQDLHPLELAPDEELIDGSFGPCTECAQRYKIPIEVEGGAFPYRYETRSRGDCKDCKGSGECGEQCGAGHACGHDCETCDGSGKCTACNGTGFGGVRLRQKEEAAA